MSADEPTWRVYAPEWLSVYTSDQLEVPGMRECQAVFDLTYAGRVRLTDMRIKGIGLMRPAHYCLQLRLWNLKGEYKDRREVLDHSIEIPHAHLVQRGSPEERELTEYGKRMLPQPG